MDKTIRDDYQISTLKKSLKKGKTEIINKYVKKIHHLQNRKGDASKVAKCQRKAKKLQEEVAVLQKIKARDMCKVALGSKDKDWKNVLSQDGLSLEDRCHALLSNHSAVQAALEKLHPKSRCPKSIQKPSKGKKTSKKGDLSGEKKAEKQSLKKGKPPRIRKNAALKKKRHLVEEIPEMQGEDGSTDFPSAERLVVKAKKRKKKRKSSEKEEKGLMSNELPEMRDCLKDQEDGSGGSEKENLSFTFSNGTAPKRSNVVLKNSESDGDLELLCQSKPKSRKRKASIIDYQLGEEQLVKGKTKKQCLVKEKLPELQSSLSEKPPELPTSPERPSKISDKESEISDKESESSNHLESQQQTMPSRRKKTSKKEEQSEEEKTQVQCFEEKLPRKTRKTVLNENQLVEERVQIQGSPLNKLPEIMQFSKDDNEENNSEGLGGKGQETSRKRKPSVSERSNKVTKKLCKGSEVEKDSELRDSIPKKPKQEKLLDQAKQFTPDNLIELMYQLDLSILCSLRKSMNEHLYPSLTLTFGDPEISKFSDIVIRHQEKSVHICVESVDSFIPSNIDYSWLFNKDRPSCSLNSYFGSFVKHVISKSDALHFVDYLIIYTNAGLDLTEENQLKRGVLKNFYPFRFESINVEDHDVMKTFLCTRNNLHKFYQFSQDKPTRKELLKQLKISPTMQKSLGKNFPAGFEKEIKEAFLDKLVFAVDQPNREELNRIVRTEMKQKCEHGYMKLQKKILSKLEKHGQNVSGIVYEFYAYVLFLHDVFSQKNMLSLKIDGGSIDASFGVTIDYKGRTSYLKTHYAEGDIGYNHLFRSRPKNSWISIDRLFTLFVKKIEESLRYFIVYTNGNLDLTEEMEVKRGKCRVFYPLKFESVDVKKKKYKLLRNCSCIEGNSFYQFSKEEKTREKLLSLLKLPPSLKEANGLNDKELKEQFLDKLIFVANQPKWKKLNNLVTEKVDSGTPYNQQHSVVVDNQFDTPYKCEGLFEIALRWFESYDTSPINREGIEKFLEDFNCDILSYRKIEKSEIEEIFQFARGVVGREGTFGFRQFLRFLLKGDGRHCLAVLEKEGIKLSTLSFIMHGAGNRAIETFNSFYACFFDKEGSKTHYMKTLEQEGIYLSLIAGLLSKTRANAAVAFTDLYHLWFDCNGEKTKYLKDIQENGIDLLFMCNLLRGAGTTAAKAFKEFYDVWVDKNGKRRFDEKGRTRYLKSLQKEGIDLFIVSNILSGAGNNAPKAFIELYDLWIDDQGKKTKYVTDLEQQGMDLSDVSRILKGAGNNGSKAFKDFYESYFENK